MHLPRAARILTLLALLPAPAAAQDGRGASVAGGVSATNMESTTTASLSGAFEYRFTPVVGLEVEAALVPTLKASFPEEPLTIQSAATELSSLGGAPGAILQVFPAPSLTNFGGRLVVLTNAVRLRIPTNAARIEPFFVAGGGVASMRQTADIVYSFPILTLVPPGSALPLRTITQRVTRSEVDLALTLGGGAGIRVARHLSVDVDLRLLRLMGDADRNVGRFGVAARYVF